jgi:hypothetical protein
MTMMGIGLSVPKRFVRGAPKSVKLGVRLIFRQSYDNILQHLEKTMEQFSKKELAAILLKVPESGSIWLDEMIRKSLAAEKPATDDDSGYVTEFPEIPAGYTENLINDGVSPVPEGTAVDLIYLDGTEFKDEVCKDIEWFRDEREHVRDSSSCIYAYKISKP